MTDHRTIPTPRGATIHPLAPGGLCQSLTHTVDEDVPATHVLAVPITEGVVADVVLCDLCTTAVMAATDYAGG